LLFFYDFFYLKKIKVQNLPVSGVFLQKIPGPKKAVGIFFEHCLYTTAYIFKYMYLKMGYNILTGSKTAI